MDKIIFLDIDGCLNCRTTKERHGPFLGIDQKLVKIFNQIIKKTGAKVVLSSTWRLSEDWLDTMIDNGLQCMFLGRTPHFGGEYRGNTRGLEIQKWLSDYNKEVKFCVIDDDNDMLPDQKLFQTSFETGLTEEIAKNIISYLGEK
jgi:hypothetical protein